MHYTVYNFYFYHSYQRSISPTEANESGTEFTIGTIQILERLTATAGPEFILTSFSYKEILIFIELANLYGVREKFRYTQRGRRTK